MDEFVEFIPEKEAAPVPPRRRKAISRISRFLTNKFFIATVAFIGIMLFLDKNDLFSTLEKRKQLNNLELSKQHYINELQELHKIKNSLETDPAIIEKLAREKYLMKRENEDIFLTEDNTKQTN